MPSLSDIVLSLFESIETKNKDLFLSLASSSTAKWWTSGLPDHFTLTGTLIAGERPYSDRFSTIEATQHYIQDLKVIVRDMIVDDEAMKVIVECMYCGIGVEKYDGQKFCCETVLKIEVDEEGRRIVYVREYTDQLAILKFFGKDRF